MRRKLYIAVVCALLASLPLAIFAGQTRQSGTTWTALHLSQGIASSYTGTDGKNYIYVSKKFYFNPANAARRAVAYGGYAGVALTSDIFDSETTADSTSMIGYMLDESGHRMPYNDSLVIFSNRTLTDAYADTHYIRLDNISNVYNVQHGVEIKIKRQQKAADDDSADVKAMVYFN